MENIKKKVKSLEDSRLLLKRISETIQIEVKEQKVGLFSMLLGTLATSLLGNILTGKEIIKKRYCSKGLQFKVLRFNKGKGVIIAGHESWIFNPVFEDNTSKVLSELT